jgi:hypothetical protein
MIYWKLKFILKQELCQYCNLFNSTFFNIDLLILKILHICGYKALVNTFLFKNKTKKKIKKQFKTTKNQIKFLNKEFKKEKIGKDLEQEFLANPHLS